MILNLTKNWSIILIGIIAAVLRFYQLGLTPPGLFVDEASNGYNAYSILKTAKDEYGNLMPLTFRAFGDYNPAFSVYTLVPSIAIFGLNNFAVRFPSAFFGTLTVFIVYLLVKKLFDDAKIKSANSKTAAIFSAFFLAISPWHLQFSRYDHEANFMLFFAILGLTIFVYSLKKTNLLPFSALAFGIALNTYHGAKVEIPAIIFMLVLIFRKEILNLKKELILPVIILSIFAMPFILNFQNSLIRGQSVGILKDQKPLNSLVSHYLSHYSPNFLFTNGDNIGRHSVSGMGELYIFQIPLVIFGLIFLTSQKGKLKNLLLGLLLVAPISASLAQPAPHALRSILFAPVWAIISAFGVTAILTATKSNKMLKTGILSLLFLVGLYNFITYLHLYYKHYPKIRGRDWDDGYSQMVTYVNSIKDDYQTIAMSNYFGHPYIFVLFYTAYDPKTYQTQSHDKNAFDKYEFFGSSWAKTKEGKALVITPPWQAHPDNVLKEIFAQNGDLTFTVSETQ